MLTENGINLVNERHAKRIEVHADQFGGITDLTNLCLAIKVRILW